MSSTARYDEADRDRFAAQVLRDGFCVLPAHLARERLRRWAEAFAPRLQAHIAREGDRKNRGPGRFYVTLPFEAPFADPAVFDDDDIIAIVGRLVGDDAVMCQLATDTPLRGSEHQEVHRDTPPLFPESGQETPPFQLAVNFPLCDVTTEMGPFEVARGTHMLTKAEGLRRLANGEAKLEPILMQLGDVMIRDVRGLHRGTPNRTSVPRPMVVVGYSRRWLLRPEVNIRVPRSILPGLSERARRLLRFNPIVDRADESEVEIYQSFAY
jgi:hypothetical protein